MAHALAEKPRMLLGYQDERIPPAGEKDFTASRIGGIPTFPAGFASPPLDTFRCPLCDHLMLQVCQLYAPLDHSPYHRTLHVVACPSKKCWNKKESWKCLRTQALDPSYAATTTKKTPTVTTAPKTKSTDWTDGADDWGEDDDDEMPSQADDDDNNGNIADNLNALRLTGAASAASSNSSTSLDFSESQTDSLNANAAAAGGSGTKDASSSRQVLGTAEIEPDQDGLDVIAMESPESLNKTRSLIPELFSGKGDEGSLGLLSSNQMPSLVPYYLYVGEEESSAKVSEHERQLLLEYRESEKASEGAKAAPGGGDSDGYEKVLPRHGDALFHKMMSVIQENPGQLLRYSRDARHRPLLLAPLADSEREPRCAGCGSGLLPELQLLPSLINALEASDEEATGGAAAVAPLASSVLEFGTVVVYTCAKSCWDSDGDKVKFEQVLVQAESM